MAAVNKTHSCAYGRCGFVFPCLAAECDCERNAKGQFFCSDECLGDSGDHMDYITVYFDLETTGLIDPMTKHHPDIVEIGAVVDLDADPDECPPQTFSRLVRLATLKAVPEDAVKIHGITTEDLAKDDVEPLKTVWLDFLHWLQQWRVYIERKNCALLLVAHNCFDFDRPVLLAALQKAGLTVPPCIHFSDSLLALKRVYGTKIKSYALSKLVNLCSADEQEPRVVLSHRALADVHALRAVMNKKLAPIKGVSAATAVHKCLLEIMQPKMEASASSAAAAQA